MDGTGRVPFPQLHPFKAGLRIPKVTDNLTRTLPALVWLQRDDKWPGREPDLSFPGLCLALLPSNDGQISSWPPASLGTCGGDFVEENVSSPSQNCPSSNILSQQICPPSLLPSPAGRVRFKGGSEALAGPWLAKPGCLGIVGGRCFLAKALSLGCRGCGWYKDRTCEWVHPALPPHGAVQKSPTPPSISQTFQWEQGWAAGCTHRAGHRGDWTVMWEMQGKHTGAIKEGHV